jgi:hypothetical protein
MAPRGEICPLGGNAHPIFHPQGWTLHCSEEWRVEQRISTQGITSPPGDKIRPWGLNFAPGGEVKNGPLMTPPGNGSSSAAALTWATGPSWTKGQVDEHNSRRPAAGHFAMDDFSSRDVSLPRTNGRKRENCGWSWNRYQESPLEQTSKSTAVKFIRLLWTEI